MAKKALSVADLINKKYKLLDFDGKWLDAFSQPEKYGTWFIYGNSSNGKTSFVLQLVKYLAKFGKVAYNSLEESSAHTMREAFLRVGMQEVGSRVILLERENMEDLSKRLKKPKSPEIVVIDSFQYSQLNYRSYIEFKENHPNKLIIFVSHADGKNPEGRAAKSVMYDSTLKIWVEGFRAISKGRYIGTSGYYDIWEERANKYWNNQ